MQSVSPWKRSAASEAESCSRAEKRPEGTERDAQREQTCPRGGGRSPCHKACRDPRGASGGSERQLLGTRAVEPP